MKVIGREFVFFPRFPLFIVVVLGVFSGKAKFFGPFQRATARGSIITLSKSLGIGPFQHVRSLFRRVSTLIHWVCSLFKRFRLVKRKVIERVILTVSLFESIRLPWLKVFRSEHWASILQQKFSWFFRWAVQGALWVFLLFHYFDFTGFGVV